MTTDPANADHAGLRCVDQLITHYGESHQNPRNELIHFIAIPLIMLSLVGILFALHPFVAYAFVAASMVLWSALTVAVVFAMGPRALSISATIFVGAWVLQFIGNKIEGKSHRFLKIFSTSGSGQCLCSASCLASWAFVGDRSTSLGWACKSHGSRHLRGLKDVPVTNFVSGFFRFALKLVLAAFGLVFVVSLLAAALVVVVFSLLKSLLTGKKPAVAMTFNRFQQYSPKGMWPGAGGREAQSGSAKVGDVVDVEVREIRNDK